MKRKVKFDNVEIIQGLYKGDEKVIDFLYQHYFTNIFLFIKNNSGTLEDAKDVFQDALLIVYENIVQDKIELHDEFQKYLFVICKNIWAKRITRQKIYNRILDDLAESGRDDDGIESTIETVQKKKLYFDHFNTLTERCKKMILFFESGKSLEDIAVELNIESLKYAKKLKYKCKKRLFKRIKNDPRFNELSND